MVSRTLRTVGAFAAIAFLLGALEMGLVATSVLEVDLGLSSPESAVPLAGTPFSFGAAGDFGFDGDAQAVMAAMGSAGEAFAIVLGDTSYGDTSEQDWCNYFESQVGDGRVVLIVGNHDDGSDADIDILREHCNFGIGVTIVGDYGKEFYFDYPGGSPLARFILTGCDVLFSCGSGDAHYNFVSDAIDGARTAGIPWVIVGMHKVCLSVGGKSCEIGEAILNLLIDKRVDLFLGGHEHNYQRSKQLTCATAGSYRQECIANDGSDGRYTKGAGLIYAVQGTGGASADDFGSDSEREYFAAGDGTTTGFVRYTVGTSSLRGDFTRAAGGSYSDSFIIEGDTTPGDPSPPEDTTPGIFASPLSPMLLGVAAGIAGLAIAIALVARKRTRTARANGRKRRKPR